MLGNAGLTDGVVNELDRALAARTSAELVQRVGHVGVFYRRRKELPKILIPD